MPVRLRLTDKYLDLDNKDYVAQELLAETQHLTGRNIDAEQTLSNYFLSGGDSLRATYIYAKVLTELKQEFRC